MQFKIRVRADLNPGGSAQGIRLGDTQGSLFYIGMARISVAFCKDQRPRALFIQGFAVPFLCIPPCRFLASGKLIVSTRCIIIQRFADGYGSVFDIEHPVGFEQVGINSTWLVIITRRKVPIVIPYEA